MPTSFRRLLFALLLAAGTLVPARAQGSPTPDLRPEEVGIEERLGATVPLDLVLKAEDGSPVTLRQLIYKPCILYL